MICVYDKERLAGFGRILCDGVVHALILDMIAHPEYQRKGIGSRIPKFMVKECIRHRIRVFNFSAPKTVQNFMPDMDSSADPKMNRGWRSR